MATTSRRLVLDGKPSIPAATDEAAMRAAVAQIRTRLEKLDAAVNRTFTTLDASSPQRELESLQNQIAILSKQLENLAAKVGSATGAGSQPGSTIVLDFGDHCDVDVPVGFNVPPAVTGEDPTATIGFTAVNGVATTFMRSDAAPALSNTLVTAADDSFSLATASDVGSTSQRGNITLEAGSNVDHAGSTLVLGGATLTGDGGVALTTQGTLTVVAGAGDLTYTDEYVLFAGRIGLSTLDTFEISTVELFVEATDDMYFQCTDGSISFDSAVDLNFSAQAAWSGSAQNSVTLVSITSEVILAAETDIRLQCTTGNVNVQDANLHLITDGKEVQLGAGIDLRLFHDGTDSWVRNDTGMLFLSAGAVVQAQYDATSWDLRTSVRASGVSSPAQITSNQNDYAGLASTSFALRLDADAARSITGLAGGVDGRLVWITNIGANTITLTNQDAGSTAANRLAFGADIVLGTDVSTLIRYDGASSRWRAA